MRSRKGATLGLVAFITLIVILIGVAFFAVTKAIGGFRELSHATDAGVLSVAKRALVDPYIDLSDAAIFPNVDVRNNFVMLGETPGNRVSLKNYNKLVAQSILVALNARDENTPVSAQNARNLWRALNDVGKALTRDLTDESVMAVPFDDIASQNNSKMLGASAIGSAEFSAAYMKRGAATNVYVSPQIAAIFANSPLRLSTNKNPQGMPYLPGYAPISINLRASGQTLSFFGVPVGPNERPHLVSANDFMPMRTDDFAVGTGGPAYPAGTLPPNSFKFLGQTEESRSRKTAASLACAIVGSLNAEYPMQIENGYLVIKNGPSAPGMGGKSLANSKDDIFAEELAVGVVTQGSQASDLFTDNFNLWDAWAAYNKNGGSMPNLALSQQDIRKGDGTVATLNELKTIANPVPTYSGTAPGVCLCNWKMYGPYPVQMCVDALQNFKNGFNKFGSVKNGTLNDNGFTNIEQFKADILIARADPNLKTCADVNLRAEPTGVKWYEKGRFYATPRLDPVNFGEVRSPFEYLKMIGGNCVFPSSRDTVVGPIMKRLLVRCQQIVPSTTMGELEKLLGSQDLPLDGKLYIYKSDSKLTLKSTPPPVEVPGTQADGTRYKPVGLKDYDDILCFNGEILGRQANSVYYANSGFGGAGDGDGDYGQPFGYFPSNSNTRCSDEATWTPSSGFNNLLGELSFNQVCEGGGKFCKPN